MLVRIGAAQEEIHVQKSCYAVCGVKLVIAMTGRAQTGESSSASEHE